MEGEYANGHTYRRVQEFPEPDVLDEDYWFTVVFPATGDDIDSSVAAWYGAQIIHADNRSFMGQSYEWTG